MMLGTELRAKKLSWREVTGAVNAQITEILKEPLVCTAAPDDESYWDTQFSKPGLSLAQIHTVLKYVNADEAMRIETLPCPGDHMAHSVSIGMSLSEALLKRQLQEDWDVQLIEKDGLYLIGVKALPVTPKESAVKIGEKIIRFAALKSKAELLNYLQENGASHASLMDFCEFYREQFGNELCWPYPISDGKHHGTFLVLVKEGILSLPYDESDKEDYELFQTEDAVMFRYSEEMQIFIDDWNFFDMDLRNAMYAMKQYLEEQEEIQNERED